MPIVAKQIDAGSTLEQIRQQFNNLQSDVVTLQASPTYGTALIFEGTTNDDFETSLTAQDPTADRTIYLPNISGTLLTDQSTLKSTTSEITANNSTNETVYLTFVDGATGEQGLESDTGLTYNPSTNALNLGSIVISNGSTIGSASDQDAIAISSAGLVTLSAAAALSVTGTSTFNEDVTFTGASLNMVWDKSDNALEFVDGAKIKMGAGGDLELYHNGSNSYLTEAGDGEGSLYVLATNLILGDHGGTHTYLSGTSGGAVAIYHDNSMKFTTATAGISVTGSGTFSTNLVIGDGGNIGSASDTDALAIDASGNVTASQNVTITGNLTVNGTTTTVSTSNTVIGDSLIELNSGAGSNSNDLGIVMERGSTGDNAIIAWDESADKFTLGTTTATGASTGNLSITAGTLVVSALEGTLSTAAQTNITSLGTLTALTVDNIIIDGTTIGHTSDTDLLGFASGVLTISGRTDVTGSLYLTGDEKHVRWYNGSNYVNLGASSSLSSNLTFILPTADGSAGQALITDGSGNFSFAANNIGNATTFTTAANNSTDETVYPVFVDGATGEQAAETDTGLTYNPSSGLLSTAGITLTGALTVAGTTTLNGALVLGDAAADALTINATTTVNENMTWTDNDKAIFGTGGDLEIYHDGTNSKIVNTATSDFIIDAAGDIKLDADGGDIHFLDGGTSIATFEKYDVGNGGLRIITHQSDADIVFRINDGGSAGDVFTLDSSEAGAGLFAAGIGVLGGTVAANIGVNVPNEKYIAWFDSGTSGGTAAYARGVAGALHFGGGSYVFNGDVETDFNGNVKFSHDGAILYFGNDDDVYLEHVADTGLRFPDGDKLIFGTGSDLNIFHDGSNSYIHESGTGALYLASSLFHVTNNDATESIIYAAENAGVNLYFDNSKKLETFTDGVIDFPSYTRPEEYKGYKVPEVLLSGNHEEIDKWKKNNLGDI